MVFFNRRYCSGFIVSQFHGHENCAVSIAEYDLNPKQCGGLERVILFEYDYLQKQGHKARIFASRVIGDHAHITQISAADGRHRILKNIYFLKFGVHTLGYDVLHGHYTPAIALFFPRRSCIHFHGLAVSELPLYRFFP